jgi:peptidyl-prolyl cis-trans isomerase SurA
LTLHTLLPLALSLLAAAPSQVVDRVAAVVDGEVLTLSDLQERAGEEWERVERLPPGPAREEARRAALRRALDVAISERLVANQAKALQLEVTEAQVDAAVQDIKTRNRFDDAQLDRALAEQGTDRATFRTQVRRELETYQVLQFKVRNRVKLSDDDVLNYYRRHPGEFGGELELRVRHIFLPVREGAPKPEADRARELGERVLQRLATGEDFAAVAREVSKGPSAPDGGDLGWLRRGTIQKQLEDAAFALEDGQVSKLVRAGPGFHVLKVEERRVGGGRKFEEVAEEIRMRLYEEQVDKYRAQYLEELKKEAHIEVRLPELAG